MEVRCSTHLSTYDGKKYLLSTVEFLRYRMCENNSFKRLHKMDLSKKGSNAL